MSDGYTNNNGRNSEDDSEDTQYYYGHSSDDDSDDDFSDDYYGYSSDDDSDDGDHFANGYYDHNDNDAADEALEKHSDDDETVIDFDSGVLAVDTDHASDPNATSSIYGSYSEDGYTLQWYSVDYDYYGYEDVVLEAPIVAVSSDDDDFTNGYHDNNPTGAADDALEHADETNAHEYDQESNFAFGMNATGIHGGDSHGWDYTEAAITQDNGNAFSFLAADIVDTDGIPNGWADTAQIFTFVEDYSSYAYAYTTDVETWYYAEFSYDLDTGEFEYHINDSGTLADALDTGIFTDIDNLYIAVTGDITIDNVELA